ncbi:hypothetical protein AAFN47_13175 [Hoeflea sp. CAU 1731]
MRYVIALDTTLRLCRENLIPPASKLVAPALLRSQMLSQLYASVRRGEIDRKTANLQLDHLRTLKVRLLGDRVLQKAAWDIAAHFDWNDTFTAEYVALTKLQADAFITLDDDLARSLDGIVPLAPFESLMDT